MKRTILCIIYLFLAIIAKTQVFYNEGFNISLVASGWTNTNLAVPWGNGSFFGISNQWQVNDNESGRPANICGTAGAGDPSLYMGATGLGSGAAYLSNASTNRRIASPNINTVGKTNITLSFNFIGNGYLTTDKAYFQYSINGGTTWISPAVAPTSSNPALPVGSNLNNLKSQICASGQGRWTNITWNLPAATENITNLKLAFVWQNDPATGSSASDPSFAVNDVQLSTPIITPITLLSFTGKQLSATENELEWITEAEINNNFFTIERSANANLFIPFGTVNGAGNSNTTLFYNFIDEHPFNGINYYRLKQTDFDGKYSYSDIIAIKSNNNEYHVNYSNNLLSVTSLGEKNATIEIYDLLGKLIYSNTFLSNQIISTSKFNAGIYIIKIGTPENLVIKKIKF